MTYTLASGKLLASAHNIFVCTIFLERGEERDERRGGVSREGDGREGGGRRRRNVHTKCNGATGQPSPRMH